MITGVGNRVHLSSIDLQAKATSFLLEMGLTTGEKDGHSIRIYDRDRVICDCLRYRNKMDREMFNKAIRAYVSDPQKNISRLMDYAERLRVKKVAVDLISVWL